MRAAELLLAGEARDASTARRFLQSTLTSWDAEAHEEAAVLLLSELVANAALHARTAVTVRLELEGRTLRLEVTDGSTRQPAVRHYGPRATTGRGLGLVVALAQRWGVQPGETGKTVWAELDDPSPKQRVSTQ